MSSVKVGKGDPTTVGKLSSFVFRAAIAQYRNSKQCPVPEFIDPRFRESRPKMLGFSH